MGMMQKIREVFEDAVCLLLRPSHEVNPIWLMILVIYLLIPTILMLIGE
ncbi:MAG: hypothetical protein ABDH32_06725 [Candidatus Caldarchaeales archaeon]